MASIHKRVSKKTGEISYRAQIRIKGYPSQSKTFSRRTDAKEWAKKTEVAIKERRYFKTAEAEKHTFSELVTRYEERLSLRNPKRLKDIKSMLFWWKKELGSYVLADITKALIIEKIEKLSRLVLINSAKKRTLSESRINRYTATLNHVFSIGVNEWEWLETSPMAKISKLPEPKGRDRFLLDEERNQLLEACLNSDFPYLYLIVVLALSTGARKSELLNLRWQDIDLDRGRIVLHRTKNKEKRVLYLAGHAAKLMNSHSKIRRLDSDLVFPGLKNPQKPYHFRRGWDAALKEAGLKNFRFHDLRHSAASYLAMNGATLTEIAEILGHKTLAMVKRYAHLSEAHTGSVVASMNEKIFKNN